MKIKTQVGIIHLHKTYTREGGSYEIWQVCDSDDEFIANLYGQSSLKHFLTHITEIKHISDLCDFGGLVDNMTWGGNTKRGLHWSIRLRARRKV